jgi:hypothetical protein
MRLTRIAHVSIDLVACLLADRVPGGGHFSMPRSCALLRTLLPFSHCIRPLPQIPLPPLRICLGKSSQRSQQHSAAREHATLSNSTSSRSPMAAHHLPAFLRGGTASCCFAGEKQEHIPISLSTCSCYPTDPTSPGQVETALSH